MTHRVMDDKQSALLHNLKFAATAAVLLLLMTCLTGCSEGFGVKVTGTANDLYFHFYKYGKPDSIAKYRITDISVKTMKDKNDWSGSEFFWSVDCDIKTSVIKYGACDKITQTHQEAKQLVDGMYVVSVGGYGTTRAYAGARFVIKDGVVVNE